MEADLIDMLEQHALKSSAEVAFTFLQFNNDGKEEINITYKDVYDHARSIAVSLTEQGLEKGDRVVILSNQTYENIYAIYGAMFAGAIFTVIPSPENESKKQRFKSVLESSGAKFILCDYLETNRFEGNLCTELISGAPARKETEAPKIIYIDECTGNAAAWIKPELLGASLAYLQYTSGSTSAPKGVMMTYDNIGHSLECIINCFEKDIPKTSVFWTPIFHNMGLTALFLTVYTGSRSVIMSPLAFMENPIHWLRAISDYKAEMTLAPNSAFDFCVKVIEDKDVVDLNLSTLKYAVNGSESINLKTLDNFSKKFEKCGFKLSLFCSGYGLAEATCVVSISKGKPEFKLIDYDSMQKNQFVESADENPSKVRILSVGKILNGLKAVIVDPDTGKLRGEKEIGEIWVQGPTIADGYWKHGEETDKTFKGVVENQGGFFLKTGDIGAICEDNLYILGRLKEVIIINGHNLYSQDIEANLKEAIPSLRLSNIISFSKTMDGKEKVITCIEIAEGAHDVKNLESEISKTLYKVFEFSPYDTVFVRDRSLPRTDNGKIQITKSRELYGAGKLDILYSTTSSASKGLGVKEIIKPANEIEEKLLPIFKKLLAQDVEISTDDNFFTIGGDSLAITQLTAWVKNEFGIVIPLKYILENPTIQGVSKCIQMERENKGSANLFINKKSLYDECKLDESIVPDSLAAPVNNHPENVFLTGSTGFVGAYLIKALMEQTTANVYCHVRAKNREEALERIISNAKYFNCWKYDYRERIVPVLGELTKPLLGMGEDTFNRLSEIIDTIYHNGALLNFIYPYSYLKNINVAGTEECLRLACRNKAKVFNHISTFSVFDNPSHFRTTAFENDSLESEKGYFLGYTESKWVAEKLVRIAEKRGLQVCIYRPGEITGTKSTGLWKMNDLVSRFIVAGIQMGVMPDVSINVHMTPVDFIANAIVHLSLQPQSIGKAFNLVNKNIKTVRELADMINSFGYNIKVLPYDEWKQCLVASGPENALKLLEPLFLEEKSEEESVIRRYADLEAHFDSTNVFDGLKDTGIRCAPVDKALIFKYLCHFISAGYIPAPKAEAKAIAF